MLFTERHASNIKGVLSCFDRVLISGTIPGVCYAKGLTDYLNFHHIRIFDFPKWADTLRHEIRANAERLAQENGLTIEFIRKANFRKEERVRAILEQRGSHPGLVHIFSAMEACPSYKPWHDKKTHRTYLRPTGGKCLHYYFYFVLPELGLCHLRVPTWAPFTLQFYYNGHHQLAAKLREADIGFTMLDNAFVAIDDFAAAQRLADDLEPKRLHRLLERLAKNYCPAIAHFEPEYHWSLRQVEYATDLVFNRQQDLQPIYEELVRTAIHAVKPEHVATFLGRKLHGNFEDELGNHFHTRIQGACLKHRMSDVAIKMYDKHGVALRIETVANNVSFFKHHRKVEHRDRSWSMKLAAVKKSIYSLPALTALMRASNRRYLEFISAIDDPSAALKELDKISRPAHDQSRSHRGFNLFHGDDLELFQMIIRGEFNISGFQNCHLRSLLPKKSAAQISRMLKRLRTHGLIKKIGRRYKYYLTTLGRKVTAAALKMRELFIIPTLRGALEA